MSTRTGESVLFGRCRSLAADKRDQRANVGKQSAQLIGQRRILVATRRGHKFAGTLVQLLHGALDESLQCTKMLGRRCRIGRRVRAHGGGVPDGLAHQAENGDACRVGYARQLEKGCRTQHRRRDATTRQSRRLNLEET